MPATRPTTVQGDGAGARRPLIVDFADNRLLPRLFGEHDVHLARIESALGVSVSSRGNRIAISGEADAAAITRHVLRDLYKRLETGHDISPGDVDGAIRLAEAAAGDEVKAAPMAGIRTGRRSILPRSPAQADYLDALGKNELVFGLGPAGTGKTYLAVAVAVAMLLDRRVDRLVLSRPAVEAGERLGFLPGDMKEKVDPYLRPLYDALHDMMPPGEVTRRLESGEIEVAPLAFMRGRTLAHSFVILDEAQNTTSGQMKMFLTRLGEGGRMAVTGDPSQIDLPPGVRSGLVEAVETLEGVNGIGFCRFGEGDVVRHPLVSKIVRAYRLREEGGPR
ncbi:PhoH family protein [Zavarzinia compransoris]|uniref:PhoH family protein n=1 Tax=Zavarzinia marina TaxID=2911065 RepID=UPI001F351FF3|nr:PhoH family protein [Zavarzinia marina]MCF4165436.1 PhoH family protein [Zavarzinia marina]